MPDQGYRNIQRIKNRFGKGIDDLATKIYTSYPVKAVTDLPVYVDDFKKLIKKAFEFVIKPRSIDIFKGESPTIALPTKSTIIDKAVDAAKRTLGLGDISLVGEISRPVLKRGPNTGNTQSVYELQKALISNGAVISADGIFGPKTENAVKQFQRSNQLTVDGIVGPQTWNVLSTSAKSKMNKIDTSIISPSGIEVSLPITRSSSKSHISKLQNLLNRNGSNLTVDGIYGPKTASAVINFQNAAGLVADGIVGSKTWTALNSGDVNVIAQVTSSTPDSPILSKPGDRGGIVKTIQLQINSAGFAPNLVIDGVYGPKTTSGVKWFQNDRSLSPTGIVDKITYDSLLKVIKIGSLTPKPAVIKTGQDKPDILPEISTTDIPTLRDLDVDRKKIIDQLNQIPRIMTPNKYNQAIRKSTADVGFVENVIRIAAPSIKFKFLSALNPYITKLLRVLSYHETNIDNDAIGKAGEITAWQLLPSTTHQLANLYRLPQMDVDNPRIVAAYIVALLKDQDSAASGFFSKTVLGSINKSTIPNVSTFLNELASTHPVLTQAAILFGVYNMGYSNNLWGEKWRREEVLKRAGSLAADIITRT